MDSEKFIWDFMKANGTKEKKKMITGRSDNFLEQVHETYWLLFMRAWASQKIIWQYVEFKTSHYDTESLLGYYGDESEFAWNILRAGKTAYRQFASDPLSFLDKPTLRVKDCYVRRCNLAGNFGYEYDNDLLDLLESRVPSLGRRSQTWHRALSALQKACR